jgi:two-component system sensor histidine kinase DevS
MIRPTLPTPPISAFKLPPIRILAIALVFGVAVITLVIYLGHRQPWLGLRLGAGGGAENRVVVLEAEGPAEGIRPGTVITRIASGQDSMELTPFDLTIEPDGSMGSYRNYHRFLERQHRLSAIQSAPEIILTTDEGDLLRLEPHRGGRPFSELPADFWVQVVVGLVAWLVSAAVFSFRHNDAAARYLFLSGAATLAFSPAAALYTTREFALDGALFRWASDLNFFGGTVFTASFIALLFHYPRRIAPTWAGVLVICLFLGQFALQHFGFFESMTFARRFFVMLGVGSTFILAGIHWYLTRNDPVARAALQWFLMSWMLGTSMITFFVLLPQFFGIDTAPLQGYSFMLMLLVYGGLALGILRYRLFDLGEWWRRVALWTVAVLLLVLLDVLFLFGLKLSAGKSLAFTLAICGLVWLPLRAWIWGGLTRRAGPGPGDWFRQAMDVALTPRGEDPDLRWRALLSSVFDPLKVEHAGGGVDGVSIGRDGLALLVPGSAGLSAVRLEYPRGGRGLFSPQDVSLANELISMVTHAMESRSAYEKGVLEERGRIAREMHDNIGAQLLAALHARDSEIKDSKIRETVADLRDIINNAPQKDQALDEALAELRLETAERLAGVGIGLHWYSDGPGDPLAGSMVIHAVKSIIRESISNVIVHSRARRVEVSVAHTTGSLALEISDDGTGFVPDAAREGNGLRNLESRIAGLGGTFAIGSGSTGTRLSIRIPSQPIPF